MDRCAPSGVFRRGAPCFPGPGGPVQFGRTRSILPCGVPVTRPATRRARGTRDSGTAHLHADRSMNSPDRFWSDLARRGGSRREFLAALRNAAALVAVGGVVPATRADARVRFRADPFTLGV